MTNLNKEREAFEAWWLREGSEVDLIRESSGAYAFTQAESSWDGWRARAALAGPGGLVVEAALASVEWLANNAKGISLTDWGVHSARILSALATPLAAPDCPCAALAPEGKEPVAWQWRIVEGGLPRTAWSDPGADGLEVWEGYAKNSNGKAVIERRPLYTNLPAAPQPDKERPANGKAFPETDTFVRGSEAASRVKVPHGQTPLNDKLDHPLLDVIRAGEKSRDSGAGSPYHGHSLEHCLHATGWVVRDLRLALDHARSAAPSPEPAVADDPEWIARASASIADMVAEWYRGPVARRRSGTDIPGDLILRRLERFVPVQPAPGAERVIGEAEAVVRWTAPLSNHRELADGDRLTVFERDGKLFVQFSDEREG